MKERYTLRVDSDLLKEMKIKAIEEDINLNELLVKAYIFWKDNSNENLKPIKK